MRIYIRHAKDDRPKENILDGSLTKKGIKQCLELTEKLCKEYGIPKEIHFGSYYRTRQMSEIMAGYIRDRFDKKVKIRLVLDQRLSKYIYESKDYKEQINFLRKDTITKYNVPMMESFKDASIRVKDQFDKPLLYDDSKENIFWFVTHSFIIKKLKKWELELINHEISFLRFYKDGIKIIPKYNVKEKHSQKKKTSKISNTKHATIKNSMETPDNFRNSENPQHTRNISKIEKTENHPIPHSQPYSHSYSSGFIEYLKFIFLYIYSLMSIYSLVSIFYRKIYLK